MSIVLKKGENPRYTIWRALHPDAMLYGMLIWVRAEWLAFFAEHGLHKDTPASLHQQEFNAWLFKRHGASWPDGGQRQLFEEAV